MGGKMYNSDEIAVATINPVYPRYTTVRNVPKQARFQTVSIHSRFINTLFEHIILLSLLAGVRINPAVYAKRQTIQPSTGRRRDPLTLFAIHYLCAQLFFSTYQSAKMGGSEKKRKRRASEADPETPTTDKAERKRLKKAKRDSQNDVAMPEPNELSQVPPLLSPIATRMLHNFIFILSAIARTNAHADESNKSFHINAFQLYSDGRSKAHKEDLQADWTCCENKVFASRY